MSGKSKNHKNEKKHRPKKTEINLVPVQAGLPGFSEMDNQAAIDFPVHENSLADPVFIAQRKKLVNHLFSMVVDSYIEAETIIGLKTEIGCHIRKNDSPDLSGIELFAEALFNLFKTVHQNDLHPLFPTILEDLGFSSDEERVLALWNDFWPENVKKLFRRHSSLINLLAGRLFPDEEGLHQVNLQMIIQKLIFTNVDL